MKEQNSAGRLEALRQKMHSAGVDLVAIGPGAHMQWLLGFHPHADERPCLLLIGPKSESFLMPALNAEGSREYTDIKFCQWSDDQGPDQALGEAIVGAGASRAKSIALDETMRADFALLLLEKFPKSAHQFTTSTLGELRLIKGETEFLQLKENALLTDAAMQAGFEALRAGASENDVAQVIKDAFSAHGASMLFCIVGAGGNGAFPHHHTGQTIIKSGDAIVMDIGASKNGYPSDITRMALVGDAPKGYHEVHAIVEAAVIAAMEAARPGVLARDVDKAARDVISGAGYGEYFVHRTGHGLGIEGHEPPYITATSDTVLEEGMVFSIEPGIYLPDRFGIRLEEIVILRANGPEIFSALPRTVFEV